MVAAQMERGSVIVIIGQLSSVKWMKRVEEDEDEERNDKNMIIRFSDMEYVFKVNRIPLNYKH